MFLAIANSTGGEEGTFLGFYPPDKGERLGFDMAKVGILALAIWFVYRGIRPRRTVTPANSESP